MSKIIYVVLAVLGWWLILYGAIAFAVWSANPQQWPEEARVLFASVAILFGFMIGALTFDLLKNGQNHD